MRNCKFTRVPDPFWDEYWRDVNDRPSLALVRVKDPRFNDHFDPPYEHQGEKLADQLPLTVAKLFVAHLARLIDDAKSFGI